MIAQRKEGLYMDYKTICITSLRSTLISFRCHIKMFLLAEALDGFGSCFIAGTVRDGFDYSTKFVEVITVSVEL